MLTIYEIVMAYANEAEREPSDRCCFRLIFPCVFGNIPTGNAPARYDMIIKPAAGAMALFVRRKVVIAYGNYINPY